MSPEPTTKILVQVADSCLHCRLMVAISEHFGGGPFEINPATIGAIVAVIAELAANCADDDNLELFCGSLGPTVSNKVADLRARRAAAERAGRMLS